MNQTIDNMLRMIGVEHRVTYPYNPRTNGQTERLNAVIVNALRKHAIADRRNWPLWIPYVSFSYLSRIHSSTNFTPYELVFGRSLNSFTDYSTEFANSQVDESEDIYRRSVEIRRLSKTHEIASENIAKNKERQKRTQNKQMKTSEENLEVGSDVYISTVGLHDKLHERYKGPFTIVRQTTSGNYIVKNILG